MSDQENSGPHPGANDPDPVEALLLSCVQGPRDGWDDRVEEQCREQPELADALRQAYFIFRGLGSQADERDTDLKPGTAVGNYVILEEIGQGGMGVVYLADQKEPMRRRVALKIIKLGMDSKKVLLRFDAERQALAMMEHGNIARVYEAGTTDRGQPFFAMEYVKGKPITEYCDDNKLTLEERLELFRQVCAGVQHAHQKGVIHRDLKPSNVVITDQDGKPMAKIIDFGVARATDHRLVEATVFTEQGVIVGTPEYMSPEQAGLNAQDIDTRSDVYSLGVLLYELLVGELPFPSAELRKGGLREMERMIREDDPPKPSTKLTGSETGAAVAERRQTDVIRLSRRMKGDLDWIVMKALEKNRDRRYQTAIELAQDIKQHLADEPVIARPPSARYRIGKFIRRRRAQVVAGLAVLVGLVAGIIGTTTLAFIAAEKARTTETALALISSSSTSRNPSLRMLLARAAWEVAPDLTEARTALQSAFAEPHARRLLLDGSPRQSVAVAPDGTLAAGGNDGVIRFWSADGRPLPSLRPENIGMIWQLLWVNDDELLVASGNGFAVLVNRDGEELWRSGPHNKAVSSVAVGPEGERLLTGDTGGKVRLWQLKESRAPLREVREGAAQGAYVMGLAFRPRGPHSVMPEAFAASADQHGTVQIWNEDGSSLTVPGHGGDPVWDARFSADGQTLLTASNGGVVQSYSLADHSRARIMIPGAVNSARFSDDGKRILVASSDQTARVLDRDGKLITELGGHADSVREAVFAADGRRVVTGTMGGDVRLWDLEQPAAPILRGHTDVVRSAGFAADGGFLTSSRDGSVRVWTRYGAESMVYTLPDAGSYNMRWVRRASDGRVFACSDQGGLVWWHADGTRGNWDIKNLQEVRTFALQGNRLAVAGFGGTWLYDAETGESRVEIVDRDNIFGLAFSPSGNELLTASLDMGSGQEVRAELWSIETGEFLATIGVHAARQMYAANFSPDGSRVVTSATDGLARVWDVDGALQGGEPKLQYEIPHPGRVTYAIYAPVEHPILGDRILTTCDDNIARIWTGDGQLITELRGHREQLWRGAWSFDGRRVITASFDRTARVWIADTEDLVELVDARLQNAVFSPRELGPYSEVLRALEPYYPWLR